MATIVGNIIHKTIAEMRVSIFGRLLIGIVFIQFLVISISIVGLRSIKNLERSSDIIFNESVLHYNLHNLKDDMSRLLMPANDYLVHGNAEEVDNYYTILEATLNQLEFCYSLDESEQLTTHLNQFEENLDDINNYSQEIFELEDPVDNFEGALLMERMDLLAERSNEILDDFLLNSLQSMEASIAKNRSTTIRSYKAIIFTGLLTGMGLLIGGFFYVREITNPIKKLHQAIDHAKSGDFKHKAEIKSSTRDELEDLSNSFNRMLEEISRNTISKDYFSGIVDRMVDSLIITGNLGRIRVINKASLEMLGYEEEEILGKPFSLIVKKEEPLKNESNILNTYYSKDGQKVKVLFSRSVIEDENGKFSGMIFVASSAMEGESTDTDENLEGNTLVGTVRNIKAIGKVPLTPREVEIVKLIAAGYSSKEIADELYISVRTVETHRRNLMQKLHTKSAISLVHYAVKNGII